MYEFHACNCIMFTSMWSPHLHYFLTSSWVLFFLSLLQCNKLKFSCSHVCVLVLLSPRCIPHFTASKSWHLFYFLLFLSLLTLGQRIMALVINDSESWYNYTISSSFFLHTFLNQFFSYSSSVTCIALHLKYHESFLCRMPLITPFSHSLYKFCTSSAFILLSFTQYSPLQLVSCALYAHPSPLHSVPVKTTVCNSSTCWQLITPFQLLVISCLFLLSMYYHLVYHVTLPYSHLQFCTSSFSFFFSFNHLFCNSA